MTTNRARMDTQSHRINRCELCGRRIDSLYEVSIFFHISGQLIRRRIIGTQLCLTRENNDIAARPVPIKIEGDSRVLLDVYLAFSIIATIDEDRRGSFIPQKPNGCWLWSTL